MTEAEPADRKTRVLVVDDEESVRFFVRRGLRRIGYEASDAEDGEQGLQRYLALRAEQTPPDAVVVDLRMPGLDGFELLDALRAVDPDLPVVVMTAHGTVHNAVEAMRRGAADFVTKPFEIDELRLAVQRALDSRLGGDGASGEVQSVAELVGDSPVMTSLRETLQQLAASDATVLVLGESGTGKELVARELHRRSARVEHPFVALHCAALPETLLESELFGHVAGAFTGAQQDRSGKLQRAAGGTLFLDEITELGLTAQSRLERFLETREVVPLGTVEGVTVDTRVVAAANRDPAEAVAEGLLRQQLYYRLNVVPVQVPPLRERASDVPQLARHFARAAAAQLGLETPEFTVDCLSLLERWPWPGNVRELQNVVARMVVLHRDAEALGIEHVPDEYRVTPRSGEDGGFAVDASAGSFHDAVAGFERAYLTDLFGRTGGNVSEAARLAGLSRGHLHRKARQLGVDPEDFR